MSAVAISIVVGVASLICVALSWRTPIARHSLLTLAVLVNMGFAGLLPAEAGPARLVSWSVAGMLVIVGVLRSEREHWRGPARPAMFLWGLVLLLVGASYFLTGVSITVQKGLLIALVATTVLAMLSSLVLIARLTRSAS